MVHRKSGNSFIYKPLNDFSMPTVSTEFKNLEISKIKKKKDVSGREIKEIQNDFSILKTQQTGGNDKNNSPNPVSKRGPQFGSISNLISSQNKSQFLLSERRGFIRKATQDSTSRNSFYNYSNRTDISNLIKDRQNSDGLSGRDNKEIMDSKIEAQIVKSNIEKHKVRRDKMFGLEVGLSTENKSPEILQDQLVKNQLISREISVSPKRMPKSKTEKKFRMADLDKIGRSNSSKKKKRDEELRERRRFISKRKKKLREKSFKKKRERKKNIKMESINEKGETEMSIEESGSNMTNGSLNNMHDSIKDSKSSQQTQKGKPYKYKKPWKKNFDKKNFTYNEIIQNQETERRKVHQKKVSLTNLGFNTKKKSVDVLIKKKRKKLDKTASKKV
jgi:hypothetical protein